MNSGEKNRDDLLAELLVMVDEQLAEGTAPRSLDTSAIAEPEELPPEWERGRRCLELLHRVRRDWSPDEEPLSSPHFSALSSTSPPVAVGPLIESLHDPAGTMLGRFRILRELGHGGLGIVYLAYDPQLNRQVALKVPRLEALASRDMRRRFLLEAEAAARLNHPHLVSIYDAGEDGPICYIAAEYCPGPTLSGWLKDRQAPVPVALAARVVKQLAEAVQHAHGRGVLHRDIKPSNVLLYPQENQHLDVSQSSSGETRASDPDGFTPKLTDFGMAKLLEGAADLTRTGAIVGTPAYMAPEQARGEVRNIDARADVYALGAILYEMLSGRRAFPGDSEVDALRRVVFEEPVAPRKLRKNIPRDLETICLKALSKEADRRYQTAGEMAADLGRFLEHEPILARRVHPAEKSWRWLKRRPLVAAVLVMALVAAAALESSRRLSEANYALQGFRNVSFTTDPPGAELAIVRLSDHDSEPDPAQVLRPPGRTPLTVRLKPGDYLVVAALDKQRFHEVYRRVPVPGQTSVRDEPHNFAPVDRNGIVLIPPIKIPNAIETQDMVAIDCPTLASSAEKQRGISPVLYVDRDEMTLDNLSRQLARSSVDAGKKSDLLNPENESDYERSMEIAELLGKRLPSEAEFECMAASHSATTSPVPNSARSSEQPGKLQNLFTGLAEWTTSSTPTVKDLRHVSDKDVRVVRGAATNASPGASDTDARHGRILVRRTDPRKDVGFRCVRSAVPRFLDY
jgi:serine/threonine-protein kinase